MALDVYSCGLGGNHVTPIDTTTNTPLTSIHISGALAVAVTPDGTKAYIAQNGTLVTTIITATQTIGTTISGVTGNCIGVAVTPDGTTCVVVTDAPYMILIDVASDTITNQIPITAGGTPTAMALTPDGLNCYSVSAAGPSVDLVQTTVPGGVSTLIVSTSGTPSAFAGLAISPDGTTAYIVTDVGNPGAVSQYAIPAGSGGATVTAGDSPTGLAITPDGTELWVMNYGDGTISVVAIPALTVSSTITTVYATGSWDACFLPDGSEAYVTNKDNSHVVPVTVSTLTPGTAIAVSGGPWGIGVTPPAVAPPAPTRPGRPIPGPNYKLFIPRKHEVDLAHQSNYHAIENWANNLPLAASRNAVGFFGVTPVQRQSSAGISTVADLVAVLQNYGLLD